MEDQASLSIIEPSITKSASVTTIGKEWGKVGWTGGASFNLLLPLSPGRGLIPDFLLSYSSHSGNGAFGIGWQLTLSAITRQTSKGVPRYNKDDVFIGPTGEELMAERNANGEIKKTEVSEYRGLAIGTHNVVRYWPRVESTFDLIEFWYSDSNPMGFWLVHGADGSLHLFGKTENARKADPLDPQRIAAWLLQESITALGEHICYEYLKDDDPGEEPASHDYRAQRYVHRVLYGNVAAYDQLYGWATSTTPTPEWHFHLVFDYGERTRDLTEKPVYDTTTPRPWLIRNDPFSSYRQGFEVGTRRLCQQVLMFHRFAVLGAEPVLVRRLLLEYAPNTAPWSFSLIAAAHYQAYDASGTVENMPPVEFDYSAFELNTEPSAFFPFENMPGIEDGGLYQCVDLFGEGLPGFLCRYDQCWYYREPLRATTGPDDIHYGPWTALTKIPVADRDKTAHQALMDMTGDGRLDWIIAQPGMCGFYTLNPDRTWSSFIPFSAFPVEFFNTLSQLGDLTGDGLNSLALIGPNAVRLYANQRADGFAKGEDVAHKTDDPLPLFSNSRSELVLLGNLLGSDMTELCRIRHNEIKCWPNLGHGQFGKGFVIRCPIFEYEKFDAARVRIADLNGSGAPALIYLNSYSFDIYFNHGGHGFEPTPITVLWPEGVCYDNLCQVTFADLQGLGCASLILTVPHMKPRHWRYDFVSAKPYLMIASNNNMGCSTEVVHRSSAQYWLDEKALILELNRLPVCYLPFAMQVVSQQTQRDEITGNCLNQFFSYFEAWYDHRDRELRGFGRLHQTDSETGSGEDESFTAPVLVCTWFHTGWQIDMPCAGYFDLDNEAEPLGKALFCRYHPDDECEEIITPDDDATEHEIARALAGSVLRMESYAANDQARALPFLVVVYRYIVREVRERGEHYPDAVLLTSLLEEISYHYDGFINDPLCRHVINLNRDAYGLTTHSITVSYARRRTEADEPPSTDDDECKWWIDAHDPAQQSYYLSETRAEFIHLVNLQGWRLGLPWRQRGNALVLPKKPAAGGLEPKGVSYEQCLALFKSPEWVDQRELTSQSVQHYVTTDNEPLPSGTAWFEALLGPMEIAQLNKEALDVYGNVTPPINIREELTKIGYLCMNLFLGTDKEADEEEDKERNLWSVLYTFATYAGLDHFYKVTQYNETCSHGITKAQYDEYSLMTIRVERPDGCITSARFDYCSLQPLQLIDINENVEEALYDPSGPHTVTFFGKEDGIDAGFKPIADYIRPEDDSPGTAIESPEDALQNAASTFRKDLFSWMGRLPESVRQTTDWLTDWIAQGYVLPSLHIRASARLRLARLKSRTPAEQALRDLLLIVARIPVHSVVLSADRYYYDVDGPIQIHIRLTIVDGFGRTLQTQQRVEPGDAYVVENGELVIENGEPKVAHAEQRWRISERVEYNNKGLPVRTYRAYFANAYGYINDACFKVFGHHDKSFYDVLGRLIKIINAKGDVAYTIIQPWYTTRLDFNDTYREPASQANEADTA